MKRCPSRRHQTRYGPMPPTFCLLPRVWFFLAGQWVAGVVKCPWPSALFEWLESRKRQRQASCVICTCRIAGRRWQTFVLKVQPSGTYVRPFRCADPLNEYSATITQNALAISIEYCHKLPRLIRKKSHSVRYS